MLSVGAIAQTTTSTRSRVRISARSAATRASQGAFCCTGTPTCTGQYREEYRIPQCSNTLVASAEITITGLNLAQSGALQGSILSQGLGLRRGTRIANGSCTIIPGSYDDFTVTYTGNWNLATGTGTLQHPVRGGRHRSRHVQGRRGRGPAGVLDGGALEHRLGAGHRRRRTSSSVRRTWARAPASTPSPWRPRTWSRAASSPRPQQVGKAWSFEKADAPACVVAQLNSSGQLIAVTTAQLQAYSSGTLSASGASVTLLNNASTPTVAGATFYVGYGSSSSSAMVTDGVYRPAVTVPGSSVCPMLSSQTALWWNPAESGWGHQPEPPGQHPVRHALHLRRQPCTAVAGDVRRGDAVRTVSPSPATCTAPRGRPSTPTPSRPSARPTSRRSAR